MGKKDSLCYFLAKGNPSSAPTTTTNGPSKKPFSPASTTTTNGGGATLTLQEQLAIRFAKQNKASSPSPPPQPNSNRLGAYAHCR